MTSSFVFAAYLLALEVVHAASPTIPDLYARRDYPGLDSNWLQVADVNGDGFPDLIGDEEGVIHVLLANGDGTFQPPFIDQELFGSPEFTVADTNGDGKADLVMIGNNENGPTGIAVCLGNGNGTFQAPVLYLTGSDTGLAAVVVGDFNGDGIPDVATAGSQGIWLLTGKGGGTLNAAVLVAPLPSGSFRMAAADFDGNNALDLVVTLTGGNDDRGAGFVVVLGNGNGTFQTPQSFAKPVRPLGVAAGPLTKGGYPGIALAITGSNYIALYSGNGAGGFSGPTYVEVPDASGIAIGDLNGDGIPDLVSAGGYVAYGRSTGGFTKPVSYPIDAALGSGEVFLADLRNDGRTDIVTMGGQRGFRFAERKQGRVRRRGVDHAGRNHRMRGHR
jgi:hypothetical protein